MIRRRYRILGIALAAVAITVVAGAFAVRYNSPCAAAEPVPAGVVRMKAVIQRCYGSPEVLRIEEVAKPTPAENEVLVKVRAASINPADWHGLTGTPYVAARPSTGLGAPSNIRFGTDYAGVVEAVGSNVTTFKLGDEVFGARSGSMAEYVEAAQTVRSS